jgi:hypothetical protein
VRYKVFTRKNIFTGLDSRGYKARTIMQTQLKLFSALMVISAALMLTFSDAHAQAKSARGIATGGDTVAAIVPEAGDLFQKIDIVQDLQDAIVECARSGRFVADADNLAAGCRQGVPPEVEFVRSGGDTYVDVELAFGQSRPANSLASPKGSGFSRFGGLDGEDGVCQLEGGGSCPSP